MELFSEEHIKIASEGMKEFFEARHEYLKSVKERVKDTKEWIL